MSVCELPLEELGNSRKYKPNPSPTEMMKDTHKPSKTRCPRRLNSSFNDFAECVIVADCDVFASIDDRAYKKNSFQFFTNFEPDEIVPDCDWNPWTMQRYVMPGNTSVLK